MSFRFAKINFNGDPNIGLYGFATDNYFVLGVKIKKIEKKINDILKSKGIYTTVSNTELAGIFMAGNSNGIIAPKIIKESEVKSLKKLGINIKVLRSKETAIGNLILCNDNGALISEKLKKYRKSISDVLGCDVETTEVAGLDIIGSVSVASNRGCLLHPEATSEEIKRVEDVLKVKCDVGTVSFGSPFVKSGIIVNSNGILISESSTGPELGRMGEIFE